MHARLGETVQQRLHAELAAVHVRKEGRCASFPGLLQPATKGLLCVLCEWRTSLFAASSDVLHLSTAAEHYRVSVEIDDLGEPRHPVRAASSRRV